MSEEPGELAVAIGAQPRSDLRRRFLEQDEVLHVPDFLPGALVAKILSELPGLRGEVHRNFIPNHKKGGSVSRYALDRLAPSIPAVYRDPALRLFLDELAGKPLLDCPEDDPHAYALYYYTEAGDHIGYHYDTSYYLGQRYTILFGLVDRSTSRLECQLFTRAAGKAPEPLSIALLPGTFVFFNGDKLYHRVTPLKEGEERIALTMELVTDTRMRGFLRFVSNMKDAIAYFGFRQVFRRHSAPAPSPGNEPVPDPRRQ
ncbi:MAG: 2OG-Fe(II) oxygenase [Acidobacteriota bacterium]